MPEKAGRPHISTQPAQARFKFGDGRMGDVEIAADITAGIAGPKGAFTDFALDAEIPALLRKGALEALRGRSDFSRGTPTLGSRGVGIPPKVNDMGHYILSVVDFDGRRSSRNRAPGFSASMAEWACTSRHPSIDNGGTRLPSTVDGICSPIPLVPCRPVGRRPWGAHVMERARIQSGSS